MYAFCLFFFCPFFVSSFFFLSHFFNSGDAVASKEAQETLSALLRENASLGLTESNLDNEIQFYQQSLTDLQATQYL